jgi:hypothetical protein
MITSTPLELKKESRTLSWLRIYFKKKINWIEIHQFITRCEQVDENATQTLCWSKIWQT